MSIADAQVRRLAESNFDRNVVVIAGAGTGKTTLLVNRFIHTLMREPNPVKITEVVALTFTNKAAAEMKVRLREHLLALVGSSRDEQNVAHSGATQARELKEIYRLTTDEICKKAREALLDLEKTQIGTLHSLAAHLIRLHPIESGVDPGFQEDDESRFLEHFKQQWDLFIDQELGVHGRDHEHWSRLLACVRLADIQDLAFALSSELVPLDHLSHQVYEVTPASKLYEWFQDQCHRAHELLSSHQAKKRRKVESRLEFAWQVLSDILHRGNFDVQSYDESQWNDLSQAPGNAPSDWTEEDFKEAKTIIQLTKKLVSVDHQLMQDLLSVLSPFIDHVRRTFLEQGLIRFDSLLVRARNLLRDHEGVRERFKQEYRAILVDEFQDTDPIQYEIILYLAERRGHCGFSWEEVELDPGKLFIVGDPKQSIYAFRRADIEAFDQVLKKIQESGGITYELLTNFRSHGKVLDVVNGIFDRLFIPNAFVQPSNVPLIVSPSPQSFSRSPGVEIHLVKVGGDREEENSAAATRHEADQLARWLKEELLEHETICDADGYESRIQPGHVGLLFRKLTQAQDYLDALRQYDIPYVSDGEKHFYRRQEVIDLVNLLRAVDNPFDTVALGGVLRSPLGGVTDRELMEISEKKALNYRCTDRLDDWANPKTKIVKQVFEQLAELNRKVSVFSLPEAVDVLFASFPIFELAASSLYGEQAVENLLKIRHIAEELADRPNLSLTGFVDLMVDRLETQPDEAESVLVEESLNAVRVLTIHKAKGLEFPVVVLPGLHHSASPIGRDLHVSDDWSSGVMGMSVANRYNLGAIFTEEKFRIREEAEHRRLLYVGMTRAKERLILSGGLPRRTASGSFLGLLQGVVGNELGKPEQTVVPVGQGSLRQLVAVGSEKIRHARQSIASMLASSPDLSEHFRRKRLRERSWLNAYSSSDRLTPSQLSEQDRQTVRFKNEGDHSERGRLIGILAHRVLEAWGFGKDQKEIERLVEMVCQRGIPREWGQESVEIREELQTLVRNFIDSDFYDELNRAKILGREVPFTMPWKVPSGASEVTRTIIMEGVIDLLYEVEGKIWVADYKTDWVTRETLPNRVAAYREQAVIYAKAASQCLGLDSVGCKLFFLRTGESVSL